MDHEIKQKIKGLYWAIASEVFNTVFCYLTVFGSIFLLFLNRLSIPENRIGILLSFFPFCGIIAPFISGYVEYLGTKKVFLFCWFARKTVASLLLLLPKIIYNFGSEAGIFYVTTIIMVFALLRAAGETAYYPWAKEFVPDNLRGKFTAIGGIITGTAGLGAIFFASKIVGEGSGIEAYMKVISAGCVSGFISVFFMSLVPGGKPVRGKKTTFDIFRISEPFRDKNFHYFLYAIGLALFGFSMMAFLPIFLKEKLNFIPGNVIILDNATIAGFILTGFLWGYIGDRFGGRPVIITSLALYSIVPAGWLFLFRDSFSIFPVVLFLYLLSGLSQPGRTVGIYRILYSGIIKDNNTAIFYTSIYYAWIGFIGGLAPLFAGHILKILSNFQIKFSFFTFDAYSILFLINLFFHFAAIFFIRKVRADKQITTREMVFSIARNVFERK